ncbi:MAG: 5'-nucleotidase, partial [Rhodospirillales bacterium]|nr:5'-nucleotidase [Rhodospirillales bacterium]
IAHYGLDITRAIFTGGRPPFRYSKPIRAVLYLSTDEKSVHEAIKAGIPGGYIVGRFIQHDVNDRELRIAFDFDGILADDSAERVYQRDGLQAYHQHEHEHQNEALQPGPLYNLLEKIASIQKKEREKKKHDETYHVKIRTAICTARNAPAHFRVVKTLREWGIEIDEIFFLGGIAKREVLAEYRPHIFFDDQETWTSTSADITAAVHVPFGVVNEQLDQSFLDSDQS